MAETISTLPAANFIAGDWSPSLSQRTYERRNPWRPDEVVGEVPSSDARDVAAAVDAADKAWPAWSGLAIARALEEAELPAGVLNVVIGRGSEVGEPLIANSRVRAISFPGSVPVGHGVRDQAAGLGTRIQLELGGHNPLIVAEAATLDTAVEAAYSGAFWSAGQKCTATRRIYVHEDIYDDFRARLLDRIADGKVGDPTDPETEVGPLVNERQFEDVLAGIRRGRDEAGTVLTGGERADPDADLVPPTMFEDVSDDAFLSREEVFGPVTSLYRFRTLEERGRMCTCPSAARRTPATARMSRGARRSSSTPRRSRSRTSEDSAPGLAPTP